MEDIFKDAYFNKPYRTRDGKKAIYHGSEEHKSGDGRIWLYHYLMLEPEISDFLGKNEVINLYEAYINDNGIGRFANLKYCKGSGANAGYDIISEWKEEINDEELDELAFNNYCKDCYYCESANAKTNEEKYEACQKSECYRKTFVWKLINGYKTGFRKAIEYLTKE